MKKTGFILLVIAIILIALAIVFFYFWKEEDHDHHFLTLYGNVDVRQVDLGFRVRGRVTEMIFEEGDLVEPETLMGFLDPVPYEEEVAGATAKVAAIMAGLQNAEWVLERRKEVVDFGAVSKESYDDAFYTVKKMRGDLREAMANLATAETRLNDTRLFSPTLGTILTRVREPGAVVNFGEPIYTLSISSPVWVRAYITEPDLGNIYPGMKAEVHTDTPELPVYYGHIGFISPVAEFTPKSVETTKLRTELVYRIRVVVDNPDLKLKQGMPVTVKIDLTEEPDS